MPYIKKADRKEEMLNDLNDGKLNYVITMLIDQYIKQHGLSYKTLNAIIGVLECAKLELYRRVAAPYEDEKIEENGDVYTCKRR